MVVLVFPVIPAAYLRGGYAAKARQPTQTDESLSA
jgi:hypothetical protein